MIIILGTLGGVHVPHVPHVAHGPFAGVLVAAIWVRVIAVLAYPAPLWFGDSPGYLEAAIRLRPGETRPSGYPFLLWLIEPLHSFTVVVAVQHAIGLLSGVLVYAVVLRATRAAWPPDEPGRGLCRGGGHDPGDSRLGDR